MESMIPSGKWFNLSRKHFKLVNVKEFVVSYTKIVEHGY